MTQRRHVIGFLVAAAIFPSTLPLCAEDSKESPKMSDTKDFTAPESFTGGIEGPATDPAGNVYAVNYERQQTVGKVTPEGQSSVFVQLPEGSIGNGIRFNTKGFMLIADYAGHNILKVDMQTREVTTYAHEPRMNQPNDIAIGTNDIVYASDPNWGKQAGQIWRINTDGKVTLLEGDMGTTNGIEVSPDDKTLYVNETVQRKVWAYDLSPDGNVNNKRLLIEFPDFGMDGMRCDARGNLYITRYGKGTVAVVSPQGKLLKEVQLTGKNPSNITFGGPDGRTCYVTLADRGCLEVFRAELPGRSWTMYQGVAFTLEGPEWQKTLKQSPHPKWRVHDLTRPPPPVVTPGAEPQAPPSDAVVLFAGKDLSAWRGKDGGAAGWIVKDGFVEVNGSGDIGTREEFGDCQLHIEWASPNPPEKRSQYRGNSGIFFMNAYEVQILDSFRNRTYADGSTASLYGQHPPQVNACRRPGEWQTYEIVFRAPRFKGGKLEEPARATVFHNGVLVQHNTPFHGKTTHYEVPKYEAHGPKAPIRLQDHGDGQAMRFRNVWVRRLDLSGGD
jgi:sugar lactone lactonase YvrE